MRCIKTFEKMKSVWSELSTKVSEVAGEPGSVAFARRQAAMFHRMEVDCRREYRSVGEKFFVNLPSDVRLADRVVAFREKERIWMERMSQGQGASLHPRLAD
jgi:hypothetical protein